MVITIKHPITREKLDEALLLLNRKKKKAKRNNLLPFFGVSKKHADVNHPQMKLKSEWD